jgi:cell division septation protein DedD
MRAYHRGIRRGIIVAVVLSLGFAVAGCESLPDFENMFSTKKRLPGERKEVFPGGVPGVTQGVPPELMKGNQPTASADGTAPIAAEAPAAAAPPPEEKPKPKPKPRVAAKPKPAPAAASAPAQPQAQQSQPAAGWPAQGAQSQSKPAGGSVWPDAPPTGTFSR